MKFLIRLYPANFGRRYGSELAELIQAQPFTPLLAVDLIAGALGAHLHPELINAGGLAEETAAPSLAPPSTTGARTMPAHTLNLHCGEYGGLLSPEDRRINIRVNIFGSLFLVAAWLLTLKLFPYNSYVLALGGMTYLGSFILLTMFTSLKVRSAETKAILIGSTLAATTATCLLAGYIADH